MKDSIKQKILTFLTEHRGWQYGGVIEDFIRSTDGHKASNASRRCRELEDEGRVERQIVKMGSVNVVQYRIKAPLLERGYAQGVFNHEKTITAQHGINLNASITAQDFLTRFPSQPVEQVKEVKTANTLF